MLTDAEVLEGWVAVRPQDDALPVATGTALVGALRDALAVAHARWPEEWLDGRDLVAALADRIEAEADPLEVLAELDVAALYLALACASGQASAILAFERTHGAEINRALARANAREGELSADDLRQIVRVRLFVGEGSRGPAIASYRGRGPLGRWVFVTALREVLQAARRRKVVGSELDASRLQLRELLADPELDYLERSYREAFGECFLEAVDQLEVRERNLLRHALVDGLNVRRIGRMYGVHFTTAARWVALAREHLALATRTRLLERLRTTPSELERIIGSIASHVDLRLSAVFRPDSTAIPSP